MDSYELVQITPTLEIKGSIKDKKHIKKNELQRRFKESTYEEKIRYKKKRIERILIIG